MEDVAIQDNSNEVRLGPMTRSRTKLIEQQVNSPLVDYDNFIDENFILPMSLHLCMIRFVANTSALEGRGQHMEACEIEDGEDMKTHATNNITSVET